MHSRLVVAQCWHTSEYSVTDQNLKAPTGENSVGPRSSGLPSAWAGMASSRDRQQHFPGSGPRRGLLQTPLHDRHVGSPSTRFTKRFPGCTPQSPAPGTGHLPHSRLPEVPSGTRSTPATPLHAANSFRLLWPLSVCVVLSGSARTLAAGDRSRRGRRGFQAKATTRSRSERKLGPRALTDGKQRVRPGRPGAAGGGGLVHPVKGLEAAPGRPAAVPGRTSRQRGRGANPVERLKAERPGLPRDRLYSTDTGQHGTRPAQPWASGSQKVTSTVTAQENPGTPRAVSPCPTVGSLTGRSRVPRSACQRIPIRGSETDRT